MKLILLAWGCSHVGPAEERAGDDAMLLAPPNPTPRGADIDGDGYDDIVASAPYRDGVGTIEVFAGGPGTSFDPVAELQLSGSRPGVLMGVTLDIVGDIDGDGYGDIAAGSEYMDDPPFVTVWFGGPGFSMAGPIELTEDPENGDFGASVAGAGDIDGDGIDDLLVGAYTGYEYRSGSAWLIFGEQNFDGDQRVELVSATLDGASGYGVATAGDVDGDGFPDILTSAPYWDDIGRVDLFLGGPTIDGVSDQELVGPRTFGNAIAPAGDFDGDGYDDVVITALRYGSDDFGSVFLHRGTGSGLDPVAASQFTEAGRAHLGDTVANASDIDGDGFDDIVAGAPFSEVSGAPAGAVYVFLGGDATDLEPDLVLTDPQARGFGASLGAVDANADGLGDVVVGAWDYYSPRPDRVLLFFGDSAFDDLPDGSILASDNSVEFGLALPGGFH